MKKIVYLLLIVLFFNACQSNQEKKTTTDKHSTEHTLSCEGTYKGTFPCADCSGIEVSLQLNSDKTFVYQMVYIDKEDARFEYKGNYSVEKNILTIQENNEPVYFSVGDNTLTLLDSNLKPNTGELAEHYILKKQ